jgi:hypothetical protein
MSARSGCEQLQQNKSRYSITSSASATSVGGMLQGQQSGRVDY